MKFENLGIKHNIVNALKEEGIVEPTQIQEKAIPLIAQGKDVIGMSKTGSGKTAAFAVPILQNIKPQGLQVLILAPTRELAVQISNEIRKFGKYLKVSVATVYGGVSLDAQVGRIAKSQIVVATPGRLLDHLQRRTINLSRLTCFVLDEADKMVDMGFIVDITKILSQTPKNKQMLLFGATLSNEVNQIKSRHMNNPAIAKAEAHVKQDYLKQYYYNIKQNEKFSLLLHLLKKEQAGGKLIFCSTIATVEIVAKNLRMQGVKAEMIHGKMSQNKRLQVIERFNEGKIGILVASAVAARGLHIDDVTHVINYDLSRDPEEYIHRVGRTARAGETGKATTLLSEKDHSTFNHILSTYPVTVNMLPMEDFVRVPFKAQRPRFGGGGRFRHNSPRRSWNRRN